MSGRVCAESTADNRISRPSREGVGLNIRSRRQNVMVRRNLSILAAIAALAVVTGILHFANAEPVVVFVVAATALGGLAWAISIATESVGERFGPAVTGALQSTFGNLPELFIVLFAVPAGGLVVARAALPGSLFR